MNPRENMLAALRRQPADYVPYGLRFTEPMMDVFREKTSAEDPNEYWDFDYRDTYFQDPADQSAFLAYLPEVLPDGTTVDAWGVANIPGSMPNYSKMLHPLEKAKSVDEIIAYPLPDFTPPECWEHMEEEAKQFHQRGYAVTGFLAMTVFEIGWYIRGMETLMTDFIQRPDMATALMDRITEIRLFQAKTYAQAGIDVLELGDDIAMQTGMMMSPRMWRKWLKPRLASVIQAAKTVKPDILVWYHTDGDCRKVIPELIEIGVDILNPVQPECMDPVEVKEDYGDQLSFSGTIGTQSTMPFGTPDDVRQAVKNMIETVGRGGGLLLAPTHVIEPDVPWENVLAFIQAAREFGKYEN